jgi:sugar O-acyltransferase (sialic acid O-acetyltransferase NeuD family)
MKDIVIIGSGGLAKEVAFLLETINKFKKTWNILGYISTDIGNSNGNYKTIANDEWILKSVNEVNVVFGIGDPHRLNKLYHLFKENKSIKFPNIIHPNATGDWARIDMGDANIISSFNSFTTDIKLGCCNLFNLNCTIGHDCNIGSFNIINPSVNISGGVKIGDNNLIGTGAQVLQNISIKNNIIIGAGSVVTKSIEEAGTYVGIPTKPLAK